MRNISFALTTDQFRNRTKSVTRRLNWGDLKRGDVLQGVVKGMGLKKGDKVEALGKILILDARQEPLIRMVDDPEYGKQEAIKEGFPEMTGFDFVEMFRKHHHNLGQKPVTRIEFQYIDEVDPLPGIWEALLFAMAERECVVTARDSYGAGRAVIPTASTADKELRTMQLAGLVVDTFSQLGYRTYWITELGCKAIGLKLKDVRKKA